MPADPEYVKYHGRGIGEYLDMERWANYCEKVSGHFRGCKIQNLDQQRDALISTVGADTYGLMKSLLGQEKPENKHYADLVKLIKDHKNQTPPWQSEIEFFLAEPG